MKGQLLLQSLVLAVYLHLLPFAFGQLLVDPGVRAPSLGTENMEIRAETLGRREDIPPRREKRPMIQAKEGDPVKFEAMRLKKARELAKKQAKKERDPVKELVITDESYFDIQINDFHGPGQHRVERITIGCFGLLTPVTCLNFISLTRGFRKGKDKLQYKGSTVKKVIPDFMIQMGEVRSKFDSGQSIFGRVFPDESFAVSHNHAGWVGMANYGPDTNGSQFYILLRSARWLDGKYVIFGKVTQGMEFIQALGEEKTKGQNEPVRNITIIDSGSVYMTNHIRLNAEYFDTDGDLRPFPS